MHYSDEEITKTGQLDQYEQDGRQEQLPNRVIEPIIKVNTQKKPYRQVPFNNITFVLKMASFACFDDKMIVSNGIAGILILKGPIFRCYLAFFKRVCSSICQRDGWSLC